MMSEKGSTPAEVAYGEPRRLSEAKLPSNVQRIGDIVSSTRVETVKVLDEVLTRVVYGGLSIDN